MRHDYEVTRLCVVCYLNHIGSVKRELQDCLDTISEIEASISLISPSIEADGGMSADRIVNGLARIEELQDALDGMAASHMAEIERAYRICSEEFPGRHALLLKHANKMKWSSIAREIGYSERYTKKLAADSIPDVYELMPEEWRRTPIPNAAPL